MDGIALVVESLPVIKNEDIRLPPLRSGLVRMKVLDLPFPM